MKRTYERILFMAIGAFIASLFYILGCNSVSNKMSEKVIECDKLIVRDGITVGNDEKGPAVFINVSDIVPPVSASITVTGPIESNQLGSSTVSIVTIDNSASILVGGFTAPHVRIETAPDRIPGGSSIGVLGSSDSTGIYSTGIISN